MGGPREDAARGVLRVAVERQEPADRRAKPGAGRRGPHVYVVDDASVLGDQDAKARAYGDPAGEKVLHAALRAGPRS